MKNPQTTLLHDYVPWSTVMTFLGMSSELARYHVEKAKIARIPNPYTPRYLLYSREELVALKARLTTKTRAKRSA